MKNKILGRMFWFYQVWVNKLMLRLSEHNMEEFQASQGYTMSVSKQDRATQHHQQNNSFWNPHNKTILQEALF